MVKKIRLIDTEPSTEVTKKVDSVTSDTTVGSVPMTSEQGEQLLKYAEQIDWKLWEILKIMKGEGDN